MKAMIFAAGIGSRLKEFTHDNPKCLMSIAGTPMLELVVTRLKQVGVTAVAINLHHHAEKVISFVESRKHFGIDVLFSHEQELLDTGGGLKMLHDFFRHEEAFYIHNADIYCTTDLAQLARSHRERKAIATLLLMERPDPRGLYFDEQERLVGWTGTSELPQPGTLLRAFCGISVASGELFHSMGEESRFSIIQTYLAAAQKTHRVFGKMIDTDAEWVDIGTPEQLLALRSRKET